MLINGRVYVFLGAEGATETPDWVREIPNDEFVALSVSRPDIKDVPLMDGVGRPYWMVEVTDAAPVAVRERAAGIRRTVRLD